VGEEYIKATARNYYETVGKMVGDGNAYVCECIRRIPQQNLGEKACHAEMSLQTIGAVAKDV
jgi:glutamyl/glutaminyl-tRNA synthetase